MIQELAYCKHMRSIVHAEEHVRTLQLACAYALDTQNNPEAPLVITAWKTSPDGKHIPLDVLVLCDEVVGHPLYKGILERKFVMSFPCARDVVEVDVRVLCESEPMHSRIFNLSHDELLRLDEAYLASILPCELDEGYEEWFYHRGTTRFERDVQYRALSAPSAPSTSCMSESVSAVHEKSTRPLFSLIVPLYHTPLAYFWELQESIIRQSFSNFEVILVCASPEDTELMRAVKSLCAYDARFSELILTENLGITKNTYAGAMRAQGEYLAFVDHDDVLTSDCLFWYADAIAQYPESDLLYCDEDKLDDKGHVSFAFCKPDWSPQLELSYNYVCHMLTIKTSLYKTLIEPSSEFDGVQDWACVLAAERAGAHIHHVRKILYHWRMSPTSTASNETQKDELLEKSRALLERHIMHQGLPYELIDPSDVRRRFGVTLARTYKPRVRCILFGEAAFAPKEETEAYLSCLGFMVDVIWIHADVHAPSSFIREMVSQFHAPYEGFTLLIENNPRVLTKAAVRNLLAHTSYPKTALAGTKDVLADGTKVAGALYINPEGMHTIDAWYSSDNAHIRGYEECAHEVDVLNSSVVALSPDYIEELVAQLEQAHTLEDLPCELQMKFFSCALSVCAREMGLYVIEATDATHVIHASYDDIFSDYEFEHPSKREIDAVFRAHHSHLFVPPHHFYSVLLDGRGSYSLGH